MNQKNCRSNENKRANNPRRTRCYWRSGVKYRKKPVVIEAMQLTMSNLPDIMAFTLDLGAKRLVDLRDQTLTIETLEGNMKANIGDWIIKEPFGNESGRQFYPCKPDIFEQTYEKVEDDV
jgi:hypothetical protein